MWLPDNIETLFQALLGVYSDKGVQARFEELARSVRDGRVNDTDALAELQCLGNGWEGRIEEIENKIKVELKRLLGVETPRKPVV